MLNITQIKEFWIKVPNTDLVGKRFFQLKLPHQGFTLHSYSSNETCPQGQRGSSTGYNTGACLHLQNPTLVIFMLAFHSGNKALYCHLLTSCLLLEKYFSPEWCLHCLYDFDILSPLKE